MPSLRAERAARELRDAIACTDRARAEMRRPPAEPSASTPAEELARRAERYMEAVAREREALRQAEIVRRIEARAARV